MKFKALFPFIACWLFIPVSQLSAASFVLGNSFFSTQGVPLNGPVAGVYDLSALSGVPGLTVTVTGNAIRANSNNALLISAGENIAYNFSSPLDGNFLVGTGLTARESNQLVTNGTIANDPAASLGVTKAVIPTANATIIRYSNTSLTTSVIQSPHGYDALAGTIFNFSVNNLNGSFDPAATFIPRFTIDPTPEPSSAMLLTLSALALCCRRRKS